ncbi:uncharacterized protein NECHADRAFT_100712 [Fusarium vanettenii 77-13-4]|uniref:Uncharacterized protein n=1 Tax=Fusarium vanettenii (strain ATCC MYA-4622 / CBS 123669 / FGSC 9596 / NRRL 45880 / 77-13-4) TaxID=660122 RepID=C7YT14_FUSV7|nr:uncharacterized protein NECHADRAFT_100712 [Fusarium vanettenii 77-13-4]EEU45333.1 predicted protein [Fusarium vanettenii 77-13-4]
MNTSPGFMFFFLLATFTTVTASLASETTSGISLEPTSTLEASNATPAPTPDVTEKCDDQYASIRAIRMILVLAVVSALHMPGSLVYQKRSRFYRLAPEIGLVDLIPTLIAAAQSTMIHKRSLREAVTATLICRYYTSKEEPWWEKPEYRDNDGTGPTSTPGGTIITFTEAFTTKTPLDLTLLVVLYAIPLFAFELISLAALRLNPPHSILERSQEIMSYARLIDEIQQPIPAVDQGLVRQRLFRTSHVVFFVVLGIPAALSLFYPFSVPGFIFLTFSEWHSANGKWYISWLTWVGWLVCLVAGILSLWIVGWLPAWIMARPFPGFCTRYCEQRDRLLDSLLDPVFSDRPSHVFLADVYTVLKIIVIVRRFAL